MSVGLLYLSTVKYAHISHARVIIIIIQCHYAKFSACRIFDFIYIGGSVYFSLYMYLSEVNIIATSKHHYRY